LIDKCPRDLNLYASSILTVLQTILGSKDINLIEDSIPCFESFCTHHDGANLSSDSEFVRQFEDIIKLYAECASTPDPKQALKWRSIGLVAIKSVATSEALSSAADARRQLSIIIPVVLQNVYADSEDHLLVLQQRIINLDSEESEGLRPRLSLSTVATNITDAAAAAAASTAEAADKLEEEDIGVLALQSLKRIFEVNNTAQIRYATGAFLDFVTSKPKISESWSTALLEMIAKWAPVQYRYLILITCQEALVRLPTTEDALPKQLILAHLISWLLASSVNLIGLSVMDVLLSFITYIIRLLQLDNSPRNSTVITSGQEQDTGAVLPSIVLNDSNGVGVFESTANAVNIRKELLEKLSFCVGNLGTHIYYSDQIADMISEILVRLKPAASALVTTPIDPTVAGSTTGSLSEKPNSDVFFSFATARITALKCVKEILTIANSRGGAQSGVGRNGVPLSVWDGTTWLLREEDKGVRKSYADAFATYLRFEVDRTTTTSSPASPKKVHTGSLRITILDTNHGRQRTQQVLDKGSNNFLALLHVAIYESALQFAPDAVDLLGLHLVLTRLVQKLNINAVVPGLPMIYRLQADVTTIEDRKSQVALSSLIAGYLLTVGEVFGLEDLREGVGMEIKHREKHGQWFDGIKIPAQEIPSAPVFPQEKSTYVSSDPILPFDNRFAVVNDICEAASEQRSSMFLTKVKDALLAEWSKEAVMSELETQSSRQASVSESRLGNGAGTFRNYLGVNGNNGRPGSLSGSHSHHHSRPGSKHGTPGGNGQGQFRVRSQTIGGSTTRSSSSRSWTVKVDELKAVLSGQATDMQHGSGVVDDSSSTSECQSYTSSDGEELIVANGGVAAGGSGRFSVGSSHGNALHKKRSQSIHRRDTVGSQYSFHESEAGFSRGMTDGNIPPVPRLPSMIPGTFSGDDDFFGNGSNKENSHAKSTVPVEEPMASSMPASPSAYRYNQQQPQQHPFSGVEGLRPGTGKIDVQSFLSGIDAASTSKKRPGSSRGVFKPPY